MPHRIALAAAAFACCLLGSTAVIAQTVEPAVPKTPQAPKLDPRACADLKSGGTAGSDVLARRGELTEQLAQSDGVICPPPGLDPHIRAPAPSTRSDMPVIPPPDVPERAGPEGK
ncbi:hypothetical protein [Pseudorhodoplanes sp.]|uniref:hypothetical protein n=1 Tax=Pseudorhodoplanes sp. TaxID=1934341 RepID=UPI00391ABF9B